MSYCRFCETSDVYVIESAYGGFQVYVKGGTGAGFATRQETLNYLLKIKSDTIHVPNYALNRLREEISEKLPEPVWDGFL